MLDQGNDIIIVSLTVVVLISFSHRIASNDLGDTCITEYGISL